MTETISRLFKASVHDAVKESVHQSRPLFVYLAPGSSDDMVTKFLCLGDTPDKEVTATLASKYTCLRLVDGSSELALFREIFPAAIAPLFYIVEKNKLLDVIELAHSKESFRKRLNDHIKTPSPVATTTDTAEARHSETVRQHMVQVAQLKKEKDLERKRIAALIDADKRERKSAIKTSTPTEPKPAKAQHNMCWLLIRLLDGETLRGEFRADETLKDVQRWIEKEKNMLLVPEADTSMPSFAMSDSPALTHYAFHYPGIPRVTFSEGQELSRLRDLGLCPRLALILKPVYDDSGVKGTPGASNVLGSLRGTWSAARNALYSFFAYGVDDAERDMYESELDDEYVGHPVNLVEPDVPDEAEQKPDSIPEDVRERLIGNVNGRMTPVPGSGLLHLLQDGVQQEE